MNVLQLQPRAATRSEIWKLQDGRRHKVHYIAFAPVFCTRECFKLALYYWSARGLGLERVVIKISSSYLRCTWLVAMTSHCRLHHCSHRWQLRKLIRRAFGTGDLWTSSEADVVKRHASCPGVYLSVFRHHIVLTARRTTRAPNASRWLWTL